MCICNCGDRFINRIIILINFLLITKCIALDIDKNGDNFKTNFSGLQEHEVSHYKSVISKMTDL